MDKFIPEVIQTLRYEISQNDTNHPIFHGCWDWHSSVHGHWALLESAHLVQDNDSLQWVLNRLQHSKMLDEVQSLKDHPTFEMPYGRAWFLRLMMRLEQLTGFDEYNDSTKFIADHLFEQLKTSSHCPLVSEYNNPSWTMIQLHAWATYKENSEMTRWLEDTTKEHFLHPKASLDRDREGRGEFFSLWGLQAYLIYTVLGPKVLSNWLDEEYNLEVVKHLKNEHHLAINASRAWGLYSAYRATVEQHWKVAYDRHVSASMDLHSIWKTNRRAYAHWVPQFTVYAILMDKLNPLPNLLQ